MTADPPFMPPRGTLPLYYAVQFGKTMLWVAVDLIAFYVLAVVERVPAGDVALVLMGGLAWHAVSDVAVGQWLERRRGDARALAIVAGLAVPVASVAFVLALLLAAGRPGAALAMMMLSRSAYALFDVPHHALIGRMARLGLPAVRIVGVRALWGQLASLALGLGLAPVLGPAMSAPALAIVLSGIAGAAAILSAPVAILIGRLWDLPSIDANRTIATPANRPPSVVAAVLTLHLVATVLVATTGKLALGTIAPGMALAMLSAGRIVASIPLPWRWRERHVGAKLLVSAPVLVLSIVAMQRLPGPAGLFAFGLASGWINILTWAWLGRATIHPRPFGLATMLTKIGLLASIPAASRLTS